MRLTRAEHPESIRRYAGLRPAPRGRPRCGRRTRGVRRPCSRPRAHHGPCVAHDRLRRVVAVWDSGGAPVAQSVARRTGRPSGLSARPGPLGRLWDFARAAFGHLDEVAMVAIFGLFVYYGFQWILLILR